jgi:ribosomal protein S18 acetylase RimI-like enzyme
VLERSRGLSEPALAAIAALEARTVAADGGRLKLEWGVLRRRDPESVNDLLWWEDGLLVGFCGRYPFGSWTPEATGMVDPARRRAGIGTRLLDELRSLCAEHGDDRVLLVTPRESAGAKALSERVGGTFDHAEHAMVLTELRGDGSEDATISLREAVASDAEPLGDLLQAGFGRVTGLLLGHDATGATLVAERDGAIIATLRLAFDDDGRGIYGFVVDPALRGQGIGRDLLRRVCRTALAEGVDHVHLEVSVDNDRALGLYQSVGFERQTTEDYYELPVGPR